MLVISSKTNGVHNNQISESVKSDDYERQVAANINNLLQQKGKGSADRPKVGTKYSDVRINYNGKTSWLEVKMNHTDNLGNPRVSYSDDTGWSTTYTTPAAEFVVDLLNSSADVKKWIKSFKKWLCINSDSLGDKVKRIVDNGKANPNKIKISLPTTISGLRAENAIPLEVLRYYCDNVVGDHYILRYEDDITSLVTDHYIDGKAEPAYYLQAGDDLYKIGTTNPFKWKVPKLEVPRGTCHVRFSLRSKFYEIQPEIKIKQMSRSEYSLAPGSDKKIPF